jgi:hypothetical protein
MTISISEQSVPKITQCTYCGTKIGTDRARKLHRPKDKCRSDRTMIRGGAWKGYGGIWWTPDLGWDDGPQIDLSEKPMDCQIGVCNPLICNPANLDKTPSKARGATHPVCPSSAHGLVDE